MPWYDPIHDVRQAHIKAARAEDRAEWHLAVQHYLFCLEEATVAGDERAVRFFAARLSLVYRGMGLPFKAGYYAALAD